MWWHPSVTSCSGVQKVTKKEISGAVRGVTKKTNMTSSQSSSNRIVLLHMVSCTWKLKYLLCRQRASPSCSSLLETQSDHIRRTENFSVSSELASGLWEQNFMLYISIISQTNNTNSRVIVDASQTRNTSFRSSSRIGKNITQFWPFGILSFTAC